MNKMTIIAAVAAIAALGSCNMVKNNATRVTGASGTSTTKTTVKTDATSAAIVSDEELNGEWTIIDVNGRAVGESEEMPYITFDNGRMYANNGCNVLNGSYVLAPGKITFGQVAATMRLCPDAKFEYEINQAIGDGTPRGISIKKLGHESYLYLLGDNGHKMLTARRHNMEFLNGQWKVTSINGKAIDDEECNIFFDITEGKVHGNTGCNYFNGSIYISPEQSNALDLSNMGVTRMACPKTEQETSMLVALEETASAIQGGTDRAMLLDKNGKQVMTLQRIATKTTEE